MKTLAQFFRASWREANRVFWTLLKISLPLIILIRFLDEQFGLVASVSTTLAPVMNLIGLPGETSLVVATAFLTNLYAAAIVFVNLAFELAIAQNLTVAQVTILLLVILVAHGLPVECRIAQKAGMRFSVALTLRLVCAFGFGWLLHNIYGSTYLQTPATLPPGFAAAAPAGWLAWAQQQAWNWLGIFAIVHALILLLNFLKAAHIERLVAQALKPLFRRIGIGRRASPLAMVGILLGLSYGGGLLIHATARKKHSPRELLCVLATLSLCHSLIEDTLLMILLGAHWSGVLAARVIFTLILMLAFAAIIYRLPAAAVRRLSSARPPPLI